MKISKTNFFVKAIYDCFSFYPKTVIGFYITIIFTAIFSIFRWPTFVWPKLIQNNKIKENSLCFLSAMFFFILGGFTVDYTLGTQFSNTFGGIVLAYFLSLSTVLFLKYALFPLIVSAIKKIPLKKIEYQETVEKIALGKRFFVDWDGKSEIEIIDIKFDECGEKLLSIARVENNKVMTDYQNQWLNMTEKEFNEWCFGKEKDLN